MKNHQRAKPNFRLYNTLSRKKEKFKPLQTGKVKIFTCGPSIYQRPHIGNYRTFLYEDILIRYFEYLGFTVERVLVFTDIEDKAVAEAKKQGVSVKKLTEGIANKFYEESSLLKLKPPTYNPRSSTTVDQAVKIIRILLKRGIAYWYKNNIYYDPLKFRGFGKLYGLDMTRWPKTKRHFSKDTYPGIQWNLGDFILWRSCEEGEDACFDDELGLGRPAWNVQDPAMAMKYLGPRLDIHCGGIDNLYRHHDYTLAIVEGVTGRKFSNYWMHGAHLFVEGRKMSKSKGNIIYPEHLLGVHCRPEHLRFYLIYGHYRTKMNFKQDRFEDTCAKLDELRAMVTGLVAVSRNRAESVRSANKLIEDITKTFEKHMNDDLDVKGAFDSVFVIVSELYELKQHGKLGSADAKRAINELKSVDRVLNCIFPEH